MRQPSYFVVQFPHQGTRAGPGRGHFFEAKLTKNGWCHHTSDGRFSAVFGGDFKSRGSVKYARKIGISVDFAKMPGRIRRPLLYPVELQALFRLQENHENTKDESPK